MRTIDGVLPDDAYTGEIVRRGTDTWVYDDGTWRLVPTVAARRIVEMEWERDQAILERDWAVGHRAGLESVIRELGARHDAMLAAVKDLKRPRWNV